MKKNAGKGVVLGRQEYRRIKRDWKMISHEAT